MTNTIRQPTDLEALNVIRDIITMLTNAGESGGGASLYVHRVSRETCDRLASWAKHGGYTVIDRRDQTYPEGVPAAGRRMSLDIRIGFAHVHVFERDGEAGS